jgi:hypothetical protein
MTGNHLILIVLEPFLVGILLMSYFAWRMARRTRQHADEMLNRLLILQKSFDDLVALLADPPDPPPFEGPS